MQIGVVLHWPRRDLLTSLGDEGGWRAAESGLWDVTCAAPTSVTLLPGGYVRVLDFARGTVARMVETNVSLPGGKGLAR